MDKATPIPASVASVMALLSPCCAAYAKWKELSKRERTAEEEDAALREMRDAQEAIRTEIERLDQVSHAPSVGVESVMSIAFELARIREEHGAQSGMYLSEVRALRAEVERLAAQAAPTEPALSVARIAHIGEGESPEISLVWHVATRDLEARGVTVDALLYVQEPQPSQAPVVQAVNEDGWNSLTDADRKRAFDSMPDMLDGFLKTWGWLHFANAIEKICREKNADRASRAPAVRMLTPREVEDVREALWRDLQVGLLPLHARDAAEAIQRVFCAVNAGKRIPADGKIGGV